MEYKDRNDSDGELDEVIVNYSFDCSQLSVYHNVYLLS